MGTRTAFASAREAHARKKNIRAKGHNSKACHYCEFIISTIHPYPSRLSAGISLGIKLLPAARFLYCLSFFSTDKRSGSGNYCIQNEQVDVHCKLFSKLTVDLEGFFPFRRFKRVRVYVRPNGHVGVGQGPSASVRVCVSACKRAAILSFVYNYFPVYVHVRLWLSACHGGYFKMFHILGSHFTDLSVSVICFLTPRLCSPYWP